jgi:predicted molibdopterin-dependent oxidoreductase YjgC
MVKFTLDNIVHEAREGETILNIARKAGIDIPTLCHNDTLPHYSSCMVCMVKDNNTNSYIPSCSALVLEGMDIDASGEEVISIRKKAIELLLSEHRAECEAPCKVVCPAGYNIPLMNRLLASRNFTAATELTFSETGTSEIRCLNCPGYCENACRRKKIDQQISIRNIKIHISQSINRDNLINRTNNQHNNLSILSGVKNDSGIPDKRFTSHIGKLETDELKEWLKESAEDGKRFQIISDFTAAGAEAENCMHCDCRAAGNCKLRNLAEEFSVKDPRGKLVNAPIQKKINHQTGLIFENAKCIKCGLCVRVCEDSNDEPALCFINRGFISIISEPLTEEFDTILATKADICIDICPTGALSRFK